ncbi:MAG: HEAT repeat domain-containing protein, partial [Planctomycetota bacterium]
MRDILQNRNSRQSIILKKLPLRRNVALFHIICSIALIILAFPCTAALAGWSQPFAHQIKTTGKGKVTKPKRIAANHFCDGCTSAFDNSVQIYYLSVSALIQTGSGNTTRMETRLFPVSSVYHRVISINHQRRGKVDMTVEHFYVQRPGREFWPFAIDADVLETMETFKELTPSEMLGVAAIRREWQNTSEAKKKWRFNMQAFIAEEMLRGMNDRAVIYPMLLEEIKSGNTLAAAEAARLLANYESDATEESLLGALSCNSAEVRRAAAVSLAVVGRKFGFEKIRLAFRREADISELWESRPGADLGAFEAMALAMARTGGRDALPDLRAILKRPVPNMTLIHRGKVNYTEGYKRYAAIDALVSVHHPDVLPVLIEQLNSSNICGFVNSEPIVDRDRAIEILQKLTGEKFGYIADPVVERLESLRAALLWKRWHQEDGERLLWDEKKSRFVINTTL